MEERVGIAKLAEAVEIIGGQGPTADAVGVRQSAISECLRNGKRVAAEWCIPLEKATEAKGSKILRGDFRPDIYPDEVSAPTAPVKIAGEAHKAAKAQPHRESRGTNHQPKRAGAGA